MNTTDTQSFKAVEQLDALQGELPGPDWLVELRAKAREKFEDGSWPTMQEEEWRRSNLSPFDFGAYEARVPAAVEQVALTAPSDGLAGRLVYEDGAPTALALDPALVERGIVFGDLHTVLASGSKQLVTKVRGALERSLDEADNRLQYWHFSMLATSAVLFVPANAAVDGIFEIVVRSNGDELVDAPHLVAIVERGGEASIVRRIESGEEGELLVVDGSELLVSEGGRLRSLTLQRMNDESIYFSFDRGNVGRDGHVHRTEAALGADFVKTRYTSELTGAGADAVLNGIYFGTNEQHTDLRTVQHHRAPHTTSRAFYRGAVRDESHAIYQGLISVDHAATGTDAYLTNKNLILGEEARADSIPSLNISTDDVRCSHGSTTGKLEDGQIFYLRSRGYTEVEAKRTLVEGYYEDLIVQTPEYVHDEIRELIAARIQGDE